TYVEDACELCGLLFFFFFQAEDGIRDDLVTGVQTCALPISVRPVFQQPARRGPRGRLAYGREEVRRGLRFEPGGHRAVPVPGVEIGRASCRERVEIAVVGWWF